MSETETATAPHESLPSDVAPEPQDDSVGAILRRAMAGELNSDGTPIEPASAPPRDAQGRFTSTAPAEGEETETADEPTPAPEEQAEPAITPPQAWSASEKEIFASLPREAQDIIQRRENDIAKGFQDRAKPLKEYEAIQEALAPFASQYRTQGFTDVDAVRMWATTAGELRRDPVGAIRGLMESFRVSPEQITGRTTDPTQPAAPDNELARQVADLNRKIEERDQREHRRAQAQIAERIEKFAADPKFPHFNAVRVEMGKLMQAGIVEDGDFEGAYERAIKIVPDVWAKVQAEERAQAEAAKLKEAKVKAEAARRAAPQARGTPPLSNGQLVQGGERTLRQEIEAAMAAHR